MTEQLLNLLDIAACLAAEFGASAAEVVRPEMADSSSFRGGHDRVPHSPGSDRPILHATALKHLTKEEAALDAGSSKPLTATQERT